MTESDRSPQDFPEPILLLAKIAAAPQVGDVHGAPLRVIAQAIIGVEHLEAPRPPDDELLMVVGFPKKGSRYSALYKRSDHERFR